MAHLPFGKLHFHIRKRIYENHEPYPHPDRTKNIIDKSVYMAGFIGLSMTIPQITKIWFEQNASGVSIISWMAYLFTSIIWIIYGIVHKERPMVIIYTIWIAFHIMIIAGIILYG